jgi:hypothetical protein
MSGAEFLQDDNGDLSSIRLVLVLWAVGVFVAWAIASCSHRQLAPVPESVAAILGVLSGGKVLQRFRESSTMPGISNTPANRSSVPVAGVVQQPPKAN